MRNCRRQGLSQGSGSPKITIHWSSRVSFCMRRIELGDSVRETVGHVARRSHYSCSVALATLVTFAYCEVRPVGACVALPASPCRVNAPPPLCHGPSPSWPHATRRLPALLARHDYHHCTEGNLYRLVTQLCPSPPQSVAHSRQPHKGHRIFPAVAQSCTSTPPGSVPALEWQPVSISVTPYT